MAGLKPIYQANTPEEALAALVALKIALWANVTRM